MPPSLRRDVSPFRPGNSGQTGTPGEGRFLARRQSAVLPTQEPGMDRGRAGLCRTDVCYHRRMTKKKARTKAVTIGRPTVFTPEVLQKLDEAFKMDCTDGE